MSDRSFPFFGVGVMSGAVVELRTAQNRNNVPPSPRFPRQLAPTKGRKDGKRPVHRTLSLSYSVKIFKSVSAKVSNLGKSWENFLLVLILPKFYFVALQPR
jgi:hypothetical protein